MRWFTLLGSVALVSVACGKGGKGAKSSPDDPVAYDSEGNTKPCPKPRTDCDETVDATLDFKDRCSTAGFDIQLCGCEQLCSGNVVGKRKGYDGKNNEKDCEPPTEKCELPETSAAFQDGCSEAGHQLMECECQWLCSGKLNETVPDPPKEEEAKEGEGDKKDDGKKSEPKKPRGNMDGEDPGAKKKKSSED
jgi:hypothetical protein